MGVFVIGFVRTDGATDIPTLPGPGEGDCVRHAVMEQGRPDAGERLQLCKACIQDGIAGSQQEVPPDTAPGPWPITAAVIMIAVRNRKIISL